MGYTKAITYGDTLEIYEYEGDLSPHRKREKENRHKPDVDEKYEKRKDNMMQAKRNFRRLVAANLSKEKPLLISLTYEENMQDISIGYKDFRSFIQALRYRFDFKYIAVPEFQKRGAVHFHALFWGLPHDVLRERKTRLIAGIWAKGFVDIIETDGHGKLSSYLAKYMAKAFINRRLKNQKAYVSSRNIKRPVIESNALILPLLYQYVGESDKPVIDRKYETRRLGECRYRLFKITNGTMPI